MTSTEQGSCGPYDTYPGVTGITSSLYVGNNVFGPIPGWQQTLHSNSPGDWKVTANWPAGNTGVQTYPSLGANYGTITDYPTALTGYSSITSSFTETMNANPDTDAWAAYDVWMGASDCSPAISTCATDEMMIQYDFSPKANLGCAYSATATFGGTGGVPVQPWSLCVYGTELIWQLDGGQSSEQSGSVDILAMAQWLVSHGYLPANEGLWSVDDGWEICSTGGVPEDFQVSDFTLHPA